MEAKLPQIIYEDQSLMVIDKPAGWITNSADTTSNQPVVENWLSENFQFPIFKYPECRRGIVHRLDKETSGLLIVAKTKGAFEGLQGQFKERKVHKTYVALVHGLLNKADGEMVAPVGRLPWRRDRFGVLPGGREAVTRYSVVGSYEGGKEKYSLVELTPLTGRTHQIRIHLKFIGHPIVSDEFYAGRKTARDDRSWCPRLFLHAKAITFYHPETGKEVSIDSALPKDLEKALTILRPST